MSAVFQQSHGTLTGLGPLESCILLCQLMEWFRDPQELSDEVLVEEFQSYKLADCVDIGKLSDGSDHVVGKFYSLWSNHMPQVFHSLPH